MLKDNAILQKVQHLLPWWKIDLQAMGQRITIIIPKCHHNNAYQCFYHVTLHTFCTPML